MTPKRTCWLALTILVPLTTAGCLEGAAGVYAEIQYSDDEKKDTHELISIVQDKNLSGSPKARALYVLGGRFTDRAVARPVLVETLKSTNDEEIRGGAFRGLVRLGDPATVPALVDLLSDGNSNVRLRAMLVLRTIGPRARAAVPALQELANKDESWLVRQVARQALEKIAPIP